MRTVKVIDLETTGFSRLKDEIAEMAVITLDAKLNPVSYKDWYFNIYDEMPEEAYKVNQLNKATLEKLSGGKYFEDMKEEVAEELRDCIIVAHNAKFEREFLEAKVGASLKPYKWICTMERYTPTLRLPGRNGNFKSPKNIELVNYTLQVKHRTAEDLASDFNTFTNSTGTARFHNGLYDAFGTAFALKALG